MLYKISDDVLSCEVDEICDDNLIVGFLNLTEFKTLKDKLNINERTILNCEKGNVKLNNLIESYDQYLFLKFKLSADFKKDVCIYIDKNKFLVVDNDNNKILRQIFMSFISKATFCDYKIEKLIFLFFDVVFDNDDRAIENLQKKISKIENIIENDRAKNNFNLKLLYLKSTLGDFRNYYNGIIDISDYFIDNQAFIFDNKDIKYFKYISNRAQRRKDSIDFLRENVIYLREAYQETLELKLNKTMQILTVFTALFLPLNLISSWYGMNFKNMILVNSKYGYLIVTFICLLTFLILVFIFKKKKLFK